MARLILINGAPASGKSTLARRYAEDHPLTLVLDIDVVRGMLGRWIDTPSDAGILARRLALRMAAEHLTGGHDVVVPQALARIDFLLQLDTLATELGVPFVEIALVSSAADAVRRFAWRSAHPEDDTHRDAAALQERGGGADEIATMYARIMAVVGERPATHLVETVDGDIDGTYARLLAAIAM